MRGADIVVRSLIAEQAEIIFGYPGGAIMPVYDALYDYHDQIKHVLTRHEQGAIHAAQGYARISGKVGVCLATSGPGATNLITGLADAQIDSTPLVCITGQVAAHLLGTDAFQETDVTGACHCQSIFYRTFRKTGCCADRHYQKRAGGTRRVQLQPLPRV